VVTAGLSAVAVVAVAFGVALVAAPSSKPVGAGANSGPLHIDTPTFGVTGSTTTLSSETSNATVVNMTNGNLHVTGITVTNVNVEGAPPLFSATGPDTCSNAVLAPQGYCVVGLHDSNPNDTNYQHDGSLVVHTDQGDGSAQLGNGLDGYYSMTVSPAQTPPPPVYSFGSLDVGTAGAPQTVTVTDIATDPKESGYVTQVVLTGADPGDFTKTSDGCTGQTVGFTTVPTTGAMAPQTCPVTVVAKPGAAGSRTAWLDVTYCRFKPNTNSNTVCAEDFPYVLYASHLLINLTAVGVQPTTPPPPVTSNPPPPPVSNPPPPPPGSFSPRLTTSPEVVPGGRVTLVSGSGFPAGKPVTVAMLALGHAPLTSVAAVAALPAAAVTTTDAGGSFRDLPLIVMAHTPPGTYPLEAITEGPSGPVAVTIDFLVVPGTEQPPQFVNRH
jgi:hypothetical protein